VAGKQNLHRMLVARGNRANERYVRRALPAGASNSAELVRAADGHDVSPLTLSLAMGTIRPFRIVPMSLAADFVSFVSRCTGDRLDHIGRSLDTPVRSPNAMTAFPRAPLQAGSAMLGGMSWLTRLGETKVFMCLHAPSIPRTCTGESVRGGMAPLNAWSRLKLSAIPTRSFCSSFTRVDMKQSPPH
jgi:hypothetical protein